MKVISMCEELKAMRICVVAGGFSSEREISLKSGKAVFGALRDAGLEVIFLDLKSPGMLPEIIKTGARLVFIALHGSFGEDGTLQAFLEQNGIMYTGSGPRASARAMNKLEAKRIFRDNDLNVPPHWEVGPGMPESLPPVTYPCVVKPVSEGSSIGLTVVKVPGRLKNALELSGVEKKKVFIEEFIEGREITVGILRDRALPVVEVITPNGFYDHGAKYSSLRTVYSVPAGLSDDIAHKARCAAMSAHRALGCRSFSRVDLRVSSSGEVFILEVNTIPGLTERSLLPKAAEAAGMNFTQLCVKMLEDGICSKNAPKVFCE